MKKLLLLGSMVLLSFAAKGQTYFSDNFDDLNISDWTLYDQDGDGKNWETIQLAGLSPAIVSYSYDNAATAALTPNNYIVSPAINLSAATSAFLTFKVKGQDPAFNAEKYSVYISTTNSVSAILATTPVLTELASANGPGGVYYVKTINLAAYVGQAQIYVAFRHYETSDEFSIHIDDVKIAAAAVAAPNCAVQVSPANAAQNINYLSPVPLSWTAPAAGASVDSYDVFLGIAANPTTLLGNTSGTTINATGLLTNTTYFWRVTAKNTAGNATGCSEFSFKTGANPFTTYCGPLTFASGVEPITSVSFGGMVNTSAATVGGTNSHEVFLDKIANVNRGATLPIVLKGNTDGGFTDKFIVFVDWNQDGDFTDAGEIYFNTAATTVTIVNSTGVDAVTATGNIAVPPTAALGNTRMRIKKNFGATFYVDPCVAGNGNNTTYGQAEDYTVNVGASLGVNDSETAKLSVYPNPVRDVLNISTGNSKVIQTSVYSMDGKLVRSANGDQNSIKMNDLTAGAYLVKVKTSTGEKSFKVIKK